MGKRVGGTSVPPKKVTKKAPEKTEEQVRLEARAKRRQEAMCGVDFALNEHVTDIGKLENLSKLILAGKVGSPMIERQTFSVLVQILKALSK